MPKYRTHTGFNLLLLIPSAYLLNRYVGLEESILFSGGYIFATYFMSPDVDIFGSGPVRRWKWLSILWLPYSLLFSHRGVSHTPIIGTLTRIAYLGIVALIISLIVVRDTGALEGWIRAHRYELLWVASGMFVADILHIFLDGAITWLKRRR